MGGIRQDAAEVMCTLQEVPLGCWLQCTVDRNAATVIDMLKAFAVHLHELFQTLTQSQLTRFETQNMLRLLSLSHWKNPERHFTQLHDNIIHPVQYDMISLLPGNFPKIIIVIKCHLELEIPERSKNEFVCSLSYSIKMTLFKDF